MQQIKRMFRQGDILLVETGEIPEFAKKRNDKVLVEGELTGHAHRVVNADVFDFMGSVFVAAEEGARLVHDEHGPIALIPGNYRMVRQREFVPNERAMQVRD
nr:hypothetical protein [Candidatus Sigynarchaeota archaeon]